jgi:hypothetical protein
LREEQDTKEDPKNWQVPEVTSYPTDARQNPHLKNHEEPKMSHPILQGKPNASPMCAMIIITHT